MVVPWNQGLSHSGEEYYLKVFLGCHWDLPRLSVLTQRIALVDEFDVADVVYESHVHELHDHCDRRAEVGAFVAEQRLQRSERLVPQLA